MAHGFSQGDLADLFIAAAVPSGVVAEKGFDVVPPAEFFASRQIWASLASRPADALLIRGTLKPGDPDLARDTDIRTDLSARLRKLDTALLNLKSPGGQAELPSLLKKVFAWGIAPRFDPNEQTRFQRAAFGGAFTNEDRDRWLTAISAAIDDRRRRVPLDERGGLVVPTGIAAIARAVAELAADDGRLSIHARWKKAEFVEATGVSPDTDAGAIGAGWLTQIAAVRPAAARIESLQLQEMLQPVASPLTLRMSHPGDPWRTGFVGRNAASRDEVRRRQEAVPRLVVAASAETAWEAAEVAVGLIDDFSESVPLLQRQSYAAFGFNAPAARAPQAILIAVPPQPRKLLDNELLAAILAETRELAPARATRPTDLRDGHGFVPSVWLPAAGPDRVRLDADSQYWNIG